MQNVAPLVHSFDLPWFRVRGKRTGGSYLESVAGLSGTLGKIALRPFSIASRDLTRT